jgi:hypothetical protein
MSLINDALKRAKQVQHETAPPPPSNTDLRPAEHQHYGRSPVGLAVPTLLGLASVVLLFLLWQAARTSNQQTLEVKARTRSDSVAAIRPAEAAVPAVSAAIKDPTNLPAALAAPAANVAVQPASNAVSTATAVVSEAASNIVAAVAPPKPAAKLQAIVYSPTRPSAIVNGKTLFLGDKLGEFRVRAIEQESVTLVSVSQTNILTLEQ